MPRVKCSTVRLTKWPSTIGIRFVTALHSLPVGWPQGQGAHITRSRQWVDFVLSWRISDMRSLSYNIVLFYHDSPIARSHFMDPTDRAIKGFYCICISALWNKTRQIWHYSFWHHQQWISINTSILVLNKANLRDLIAATGLVILLKLDLNHWFFSPCDLEIWWITSKNNRALLLYYVKLCPLFQIHPVNSNWIYSPEMLNSGQYWWYFVPCYLENWWMILESNRAPLLYYIKLCASFQIHWWSQTWVTVWKQSIRVKVGNFLPHVTLKFDGWPWKTWGHFFYTTGIKLCASFQTMGEFKLELQSRNTQFGSKWSIFLSCDHEIWRMTLNKANLRDLIAATGLVILLKFDLIHRFLSPCDLEIWCMTLKNNRAPLLYYIKLCVSFQIHRWIQTKVTVRKRSIRVKIGNFWSCVTLKFDGWPWKTIGHLFYTTSSFVHHFIPIGDFKFQLQSGNAQFGSKLMIFFSRVTLKFDGWPWKTIEHLFYATSSLVQHFIAICEFKLELQSGNAQSGSNSTIFRAVWPWNLTDDLQKQ